MRSGRLLAIAVAGVGVIGLVVGLSWPSGCPLGLEVVSADPKGSGIVDDTGREWCCVTLSISNRTAGGLYFANEWIKVEARVANQWVETGNRCSLTGIGAGRKSDVLLMVPFGSEACRLRLKYARETLRWRVVLGLWRLGVRLPPKLYPWIYPPAGWRPHWRGISFEVPLPPKVV